MIPSRCQRTLTAPVLLEGTGLHSGKFASILLSPAPPNTGLVMVVGETRFPAVASLVSRTARCTCLRFGQIELQTIEHLLSALYGLHIDNCLIEWKQGREVPALDGSSLPIVQAIQSTGLREQDVEARYISIEEPVWIGDAESQVLALPGESFGIACGIRFDHPLVGEQMIHLDLEDPQIYIREIAPARTFGFANEVEALRAAGLARGGSFENALVIFEDRFSTTPRFPDECVRHKALDVIGDLALTGARLKGQIIALRPNHGTNTALARSLQPGNTSLPLNEGG